MDDNRNQRPSCNFILNIARNNKEENKILFNLNSAEKSELQRCFK